jgi:excisionase family DNA binding protein
VTKPIKPEVPLLTPGEVAAMLGVDPKTVSRWARAGKLSAIRTPGGHRRYSKTEVTGLLNGLAAPEPGPSRRPVRPKSSRPGATR